MRWLTLIQIWALGGESRQYIFILFLKCGTFYYFITSTPVPFPPEYFQKCVNIFNFGQWAVVLGVNSKKFLKREDEYFFNFFSLILLPGMQMWELEFMQQYWISKKTISKDGKLVIWKEPMSLKTSCNIHINARMSSWGFSLLERHKFLPCSNHYYY